MDIMGYMQERRREIDRNLDRLLPAETQEPVTIHRAMRYSIFAGGKRLRPILVLAAGGCAGGQYDTLLDLGSAIEMIHTYSLIHDDLPALDNDDFRRGVPTCHKVFGEAMAILAGDSLMTRCYQLLVELPGLSDSVRLSIIREIAAATGTVDGMIGGQVVDIESEGKDVDRAVLDYIHRSKTGALLTVCTRCGGLAAGAAPPELAALTEYGRNVGLAFQIVDDLLDMTQTSESLGKTAGKDLQMRKATYPALYGLDASRKRAAELVQTAISTIDLFGEQAEPLRALARFIVDRSN